jgi:hypothetical protein
MDEPVLSRVKLRRRPNAGRCKVLLALAIISAMGTGLAGVAAVVSALATLGVFRVRRVTKDPIWGEWHPL